ncbi:MAG: hypothetical protein MHPSP_002676, partial [Paramarteilia canceri]
MMNGHNDPKKSLMLENLSNQFNSNSMWIFVKIQSDDCFNITNNSFFVSNENSECKIIGITSHKNMKKYSRQIYHAFFKNLDNKKNGLETTLSKLNSKLYKLTILSHILIIDDRDVDYSAENTLDQFINSIILKSREIIRDNSDKDSTVLLINEGLKWYEKLIRKYLDENHNFVIYK